MTKDNKLKASNFISQINKNLKGNYISFGGKGLNLDLKRLSSGVFSVDVALGGGWPFGKMAILAGVESTGKSLLTYRAMSNIKKYCHNCKRFQDKCSCGNFQAGRALLLDFEAAFEDDWAEANGVDIDHNVIMRPKMLEDGVNVIQTALEEDIFDLIIFDSIACAIAGKVYEEESGKANVSVEARILNQGFRKWRAALNALSATTGGPALLFINDFYDKVGTLYGDPRELPGGKQQKHHSSITVYTNTSKIEDDVELKEAAYAILTGYTKKNKTYVKDIKYEFKIAIRDIYDDDDLIVPKGYVDNAEQIIKAAKKHDLITKIGGGYSIKNMPVAVNTQAELANMLNQKQKYLDQAWNTVLTEALK